MARCVVTAVGADRPGIVAAVSKAFVEHGCNIEESAMTILAGQFAMMLVIDAPAGVDPSQLRGALAAPADKMGLVVAVEPVASSAAADEPQVESAGTFTVSVHGADRPGIVHGITAELASAQVNIVDLTTRVIGTPDNPVYVMILEVDLPAGLDASDLGSRLGEVAQKLGVSVRLHPSDADIL